MSEAPPLRVLYHLPVLPPRHPTAEALAQEIAALRERFPGELCYLNPNDRRPFAGHTRLRVPRLLFGWHRLPYIRRQEASIDLHHLYNPDPFAYPVLKYLRRPVVYSLTGGVTTDEPLPAAFRRYGAVTVYDEASLAALRAAGVGRAFLVRTGIDTARFAVTPPPPPAPFHLLLASAPWTLAQFRTKGVEALLEAVRAMPDLVLTLLWRGVLAEAAHRTVAAAGLGARVTLIDATVDVNQLLSGVHATVVLAATPALVKAYPHSLLDGLAAGRPVLVSRAIPMSRFVEQSGCGEVVEDAPAGSAEPISTHALLAAIDRLRSAYAARQAAAVRHRADFGLEQMRADFANVYAAAVATGSRRQTP